LNYISGRVYGGSIAYGNSFQYQTLTMNPSCGASQCTPVNFAKTQTCITRLVSYLCNLPSTATQIKPGPPVNFRGSNALVEKFTISGSIPGITFSNINPNVQLIVVEDDDTNITLTNWDWTEISQWESKLIFIFPKAVTLNLVNVGIKAAILAPHASLLNPTGQIYGQLIVNNIDYTTSTVLEGHISPFTGCVPNICYTC